MKKFKEEIKDFKIRYQKEHGELRWRERSIPPDEIEEIVREWEVIESYPDGRFLLWGRLDNNRFVHVPCYPDSQTKIIWVETSYYPYDKEFTSESDYRERKIKKK